MSQYFVVFIFTIFAACIQGLNGNQRDNLSRKVVNVNDKDLKYFDILNVIIEEDIPDKKHSKTIAVYINEKILTVDFSKSGISFYLNSLRPTNNGGSGAQNVFGDKVVILKDKDLPDFDLLNITINKGIHVARSEKIIKINVNDKIVGMDTRGAAIDLYLKYKQDENNDKFITRYPLSDYDGSVGEVHYEMSGPQITKYSTDENKGNNGNIKGANGFIILAFVLWHLIT